MIRSLASTPLRHGTTAHQPILSPHPRLTSRSTRSLSTTQHPTSQQQNHNPPPPCAPPLPSQNEPANPRSTETDPVPTARDASSRARQLEDIEVPGLMPELKEAVLRHPGVEATTVAREEKIPKELEVGEEIQHASGFIPPTPGLPREPKKPES